MIQSEKIRCFIAVELPARIKQEIGNLIYDLRKINSSIRWVKHGNIHITLKFLGEIDPGIVDKVSNTLNKISDNFHAFDLKISGSGFFPNEKRPRVVWLGLKQDDTNVLYQVHEWIDKELESIGFEREKRRFSPHLTIGRIKERQDISGIKKFMQKQPLGEYGFKVNEIVFMRSILRTTGAIYTPIRTYKLK